MLKAIVSVPGFALASRIACRNEPAPLSLALVTVKVEAMSNESPAAILFTAIPMSRTLVPALGPKASDVAGAPSVLLAAEPLICALPFELALPGLRQIVETI